MEVNSTARAVFQRSCWEIRREFERIRQWRPFATAPASEFSPNTPAGALLDAGVIEQRADGRWHAIGDHVQLERWLQARRREVLGDVA
ncbi:MAG TPA: hypothetical protein VFD92_26995 [Candidatus Binatia bacterium]|nr:hypothetical protein [Candidatus Binatia bacterium]